MTTNRFFGTVNTAAPTVPLTNLFPFTSGYQMYGGDCANEDPKAQSPSDAANAQYLPALTAGVDNGQFDLPLPPIDLQVKVAGSGTYKGGANGAAMRTAVANDQVKVKVVPTTTGCSNPAWSAVAAQAASSAYPNRPANPGYPYGTYTVCVEGKVNGTVRRDVVTGVKLAALTGTKVTSAMSGTGADGAPSVPGVVNLTSDDTASTCAAAIP
jgi:hypothetical protein